jgi:hypothetical protein
VQIDCNKLFLLLEVDNSADEQDYDEGNRITASDLFRAATEPFIDIVIVYNQDDFVAGWLDNRDGFSLRDFFTLSPNAASIRTLRIALAPYSNARLS